MNWLRKIIAWDKKLYSSRRKEGRFVILGRYRFDRAIILSGVLFILFISGLYALAYFNTEEHYYISCSGEEPCVNPLYENCASGVPVVHCMDEYLPAGTEIGEKPPYIAENYVFLSMLTLASVFILNHLLYGGLL